MQSFVSRAALVCSHHLNLSSSKPTLRRLRNDFVKAAELHCEPAQSSVPVAARP